MTALLERDEVTLALVLAALGAVVGIGEALRAWAGWRPESTRRFVHAATGTLTALLIPLFGSPVPLYVLAGVFATVNAYAMRRRLLPGMHGVGRPTAGTVTFPLALIAGLALTWSIDAERTFALRAAFLVLALADPLASITGERADSRGGFVVSGQGKTIAGSMTFFVAASVLCALALWAWGPSTTVVNLAASAIVAAGLATAAEALGTKGWDNLWVVLSIVVALTVTGTHISPPIALMFLAVAVTFAVAAWRLGALDVSGALAATLLAWIVLAPAEAAWVLPGLSFFVFSSALSRLGRRRKADAERLAEKTGPRDAGQVVANGGVAGALVAAFLLVPDITAQSTAAVYWGMVGALAAAAADTWATEIGTVVGGRTWQLPLFAVVEPGSSGGISMAGTLGGLAGAVTVFGVAWLAGGGRSLVSAGVGAGDVAILVVGGAFVASIVDSLLGGTLQARYRLPSGELTERALDQGRALPLAAGSGAFNNDRVNLACTVVGALIPLAGFARAGLT